MCLLAELTHLKQLREAKLVLQAQDASGALLEFAAPLAAAEKVPGDALAVLHAMAYIDGLLGGSSHLHMRPDGTPLEAQPDPDIIKEEVRAACLARPLLALLLPHVLRTAAMNTSSPTPCTYVR